ncbi:MAG: hypothetical protein OXC72_11110 [Roseovarius sp.]|nr:hypothetical protein [Roseovarius sp.]
MHFNNDEGMIVGTHIELSAIKSKQSECKIAAMSVSDHPCAGLPFLQNLGEKARGSALSISRPTARIGLYGCPEIRRQLPTTRPLWSISACMR